MDVCVPQAHEMSAKHSAEAMKAEKWQFEYKNLNDKYETLLKEREVQNWSLTSNEMKWKALWMCLCDTEADIWARHAERDDWRAEMCSSAAAVFNRSLTHSIITWLSVPAEAPPPLSLSSNQLCPWLCVFVDSLSGDSGAVGSLASEIMPTEFRWALTRQKHYNTLFTK